MRYQNLVSIITVGSLAVLVGLGCSELFPERSEGEKLYRQRCAECHGFDGAGNTPRYMGNAWADLTDDSWRHGGDEGSIAVVIREGIFGSCPDNPELTGEQADALARYVKELGRAAR